MNFAEKFTNLTAEQRQQIQGIKDIAGLDVFLSSEKIALDEAERAEALSYFETGKQPLDDDDLDVVAGGEDKEQAYKAKALADGRTVPISVHITALGTPFGQNFCSCFVEQAWARSVTRVRTALKRGELVEDIYHDCKCYRCGHHQAVHRDFVEDTTPSRGGML